MNSILSSIKKTGRLIVVDGGWGPCGISAEVISQSAENISNWKSSPKRLTIPFIPAPSAISLENSYYPTSGKLKQLIQETLEDE
jgi:pyruvate dehydrogenase E1 component beta subunit